MAWLFNMVKSWITGAADEPDPAPPREQPSRSSSRYSTTSTEDFRWNSPIHTTRTVDRDIIAAGSYYHRPSTARLPVNPPVNPPRQSTNQTEYYSVNEIRMLLGKAEEFLRQSRYNIPTHTGWLSRNGPVAYFQNSVMVNQRGKLQRSLKDKSGHLKNPLNRRYKGTFFMANVEKNGMPKDTSPYGPRRLMMPAYELLKDCALFFADFYCLKPNTKHYVQIVAVKPHTTEYQFCMENLVELSASDNDFLCIDKYNGTVTFNRAVWVEVMYSHNLDLNRWTAMGAYFYDVNSTGIKSKKGLLKDENCQDCEIDQTFY